MKKTKSKTVDKWYSFLFKIQPTLLDYNLLYIIFTISILGLLALFSGSTVTSHKLTDDPYYFFKKQLVWFSIATVLFVVFAMIPYTIYQRYSTTLILFSITLLILVFIPGVGKTVKTLSGRNFHRWIGFGAFQLQPSEFSKLAILIYLASILTKYENFNNMHLKDLAFPLLYMVSVMVLIILEPALGTTIQIGSLLVFLIYINGFPIKKLVIVFLSIMPLIFFLVYKVSYWKKRINIWLNPYSDKDRDGYQLYSSFRAFMESGWFGNPIATSHSHKSLPYNHTDFIAATYVQDYGFIGFTVLLILFLVLLFRAFVLLRKVNEPFGFLLGSGIILMLGIQAIINLYVVTGLFPITGISLPFVSYGGSSLVMLMCSLGIFVNITQRKNLVL
jgi:cell division protein FtsW